MGTCGHQFPHAFSIKLSVFRKKLIVRIALHGNATIELSTTKTTTEKRK